MNRNIGTRSFDDGLELMRQFNDKCAHAFARVYSLCYDATFIFAARLYKNTEVDPSDVIHDIFISIWSSKKLKFNDIVEIKCYMYVSIRNKFKTYISHQKYIDSYKKKIIDDDEYFDVQIVDSEFDSLISEIYSILPKDYADIIRLYADGWDIKSISEKLKISERTVFNRRDKAVETLKVKLKSKNNYIINILMTLN